LACLSALVFAGCEKKAPAAVERPPAPVSVVAAVARAYDILIQQATLFAYVDTFRRLGFLCLFCILSVLLFRRVLPPRGGVFIE
jgi:hypothetical protein